MWRFGLILALLCLGLNGDLFACSCVGPQRPCENLRHDAVFAGRVVETVPTRHQADKQDSWYAGYSMRFAVDEAFRGSLGTEVMIETGTGGGDCGTPLKPGDKYLIFAYRTEKGELWTGLCNGNQRLTDNPEAEKILELFRTLTKEDTGTIFGAVRQTKVGWKDDDIGDDSPAPTKKLLLHAVSDGYSTFTHTTEKGTFEFQGLPPGKYKINPELPDGLDFDHEYPEHYEAEILGGACAQIDFRLQPATRIRGRLVLPPGTPDRVIEVVALPVQLKKVNQFSGKYTFTDEDGRFDLWPLPPGDYYIGVNINKSPKEDAPFPPTYYPGVTSQKAAHIVHLDEGEIKELELPLPEMAAPRTVNFVAVGLDGKPMRHIYIQREDLRHPGDAASYVNVDLDKKGAGSMIVYDGFSYHLHGSQWISTGNEWCAKPVVITAGTEPIDVRFVMDRKSDNCNMVEIDKASK